MTRVMPAAQATLPTARTGRVEVWSHDAATGTDRLVQATGGAGTSDKVARTAFDNATRVDTYFRTTFGRNGWDDRGSVTKVLVHAPDVDGSPRMNNARWYLEEGRIWLGDGDGTLFAPLGNAVDVMGHEFTHGVVDAEVKLTYEGQEGALHESFADVLATGLDGNLTIGEDVFTPSTPGDSLRDIANPTWANAKTLPAWVNEVHDLSGIPSLAAVKVAGKLGAGEMRRIWYAALTDHLKAHSGFAGAAQATLAAAERMFGASSSQLAAVRDAWAAVGVDAGTPKTKVTTSATLARLGASSLALAGANAGASAGGTAPART